MALGLKGFTFTNWQKRVDWKLLVFLLLFLNVKLVVKCAALALIYLLVPNLRLSLKLNPLKTRLPLFYVAITAIAIAGFLANSLNAAANYYLVFVSGLAFWLACLLALHQVKLAVERNQPVVLHQTLLLFFLLNALVSFLKLGAIIWETGAANPYLYQGNYQKYFISTGDYIKGVSFDTSTTNAVISAAGVIYFLSRGNTGMLLLTMATLLLAGSNFTNLMLLPILAGVFVFRSSRYQKSLVLLCLLMLVVFVARVSPQNNRYTGQMYKAAFHSDAPGTAPGTSAKAPASPTPPPDAETLKAGKAQHLLDSIAQAKAAPAPPLTAGIPATPKPNQPAAPKAPPLIKTESGGIIRPQDDIHSATFQSIKTATAAQQPLLSFIRQHAASLPLSGDSAVNSSSPGKVLGLTQTARYFKDHPGKLLLGGGLGNFSSKLAFKATGLGITGGWPARFTYINRDFLGNNLDVYLYFFSKGPGYHSLANSPFSAYSQLPGEYGLVGSLAFAFLYFGFFARHIKKLSYGLPLLALMAGVLAIDYWFEQLSVMVLLELLLLLDIKENTPSLPA